MDKHPFIGKLVYVLRDINKMTPQTFKKGELATIIYYKDNNFPKGVLNTMEYNPFNCRVRSLDSKRESVGELFVPPAKDNHYEGNYHFIFAEGFDLKTFEVLYGK